jgi:hypothetical protein
VRWRRPWQRDSRSLLIRDSIFLARALAGARRRGAAVAQWLGTARLGSSSAQLGPWRLGAVSLTWRTIRPPRHRARLNSSAARGRHRTWRGRTSQRELARRNSAQRAAWQRRDQPGSAQSTRLGSVEAVPVPAARRADAAGVECVGNLPQRRICRNGGSINDRC